MVGLRSGLVSAGLVGQRTNRTLRLTLCAIGVFALLLRVGVASRFQGLGAEPNADAQPDQVDYEQFAYRLSAGLGYTTAAGVPTATRPPGTSFAIDPIYVLFGHSYWWARLWFCFLSALTCAATGWLAWECFTPAAGILAATWLAVYPGPFYYPMHFVSEVPYALALTLALVLSIRIVGGARTKP